MRALREGELMVNLPGPVAGVVDLESARQAVWCAPGCLAVQMDPPREAQGEVLVPGTVGARMRADCGTVIAAGLAGALKPGDRVLVRPYHGLWIEPFSSGEPPIVPVDDEGVRARGRCVAVRVDKPAKWTDLALPDEWERPVVATGRVVSKGADAWPILGARVVFSNHHRRTAHAGLDWISDDVVVIEDRQVFAILGPSSYRADMVRFYGAGTDWRKSVLMVWREGEWRPIAPWVLIERDRSAPGGVILPELAAARLRNRARLVAWGETAVVGSAQDSSQASPSLASGRPPEETGCPGQERNGLGLVPGTAVLVDPDPAGAIGFDLGEVSKAWQLVPESAVWAVLG